MILTLTVVALIVFACIFLNNLSSKAGIPVLLLFIVFGLLAGLKFETVMYNYSEDISNVCTIALIFVMFYGGFGTRWSSARRYVTEAGLLATLGVVLTALAVGLFCHFALGWKLMESFLMGSVICSTDAATVFSILRTHNLGLKKGLAPVLEIESGSNDPCSYMLTAIFISIMKGTATGGTIVWTVFSQLFFGALFGLVISTAAVYFLRRYHFTHGGFDTLFIFALAILSYALPSAVGGNGYLSVYIVGIVVGNVNFPGRKPLIPFFDAVTDLMQIVIFFLLGFMAITSHLVKVIPTALVIFAFIFLVARPFAVFTILAPFRKYSARMMGFVSFVGLRGAASIVFSIMAVTSQVDLHHDIFSIVFVIVLVSIAGQGSLIPLASKLFDVTDENANDLKTFSDFTDSDELSFGKISIREKTPWRDKFVRDLGLPRDILLVRVIREGKSLVPDGDLQLLMGDTVIIGSRAFSDPVNAKVRSVHMKDSSPWVGHTIHEYTSENKVLVIMMKHDGEVVIPNGKMTIDKRDILMTVDRTE